jgi:DNA-binding HxlR family transcriptional regulator/putative sterol carrier protein
VTSVSRRTYDQFCGLARAMDILGERWSLLIVRELLIGPKRFSDLMDGLPGIGPNALSARLKSLESDGLVGKRKLPPPAGSTVYELTELGRGLEPVVHDLIRWGVNLLDAPGPRTSFRPGWIVTTIRALLDPSLARGLHRTYRLRIDEEVFTARIDDGAVDISPGEDGEADVALAADSDTVLDIASGEVTAEEAIHRGRVKVEHGDPAEAVAFAGMMRLPAAQPA